MRKALLLILVALGLLFMGCSGEETPTTPMNPTQTETPSDGVKTLVISFLDACNNDNAEKIYSMLSDDVRKNYSLKDVRGLVNLTDFNLNAVNYSRKGDEVMVNTTVSINNTGRKEYVGWATITFHITYNNSKPEIGSGNFLERIKSIYYFSWPSTPTPLPMSGIYNQFTKYYNDRNATEAYSLLSEDLKENHSLDDVREELEFARKHGIELSFDFSAFPTELLGKGTKTMEMPTTMKSDEGKLNCSVKCVFQGKYNREKLDNSSLSKVVSHSTRIDNWVFEELKRCYNSEQ